MHVTKATPGEPYSILEIHQDLNAVNMAMIRTPCARRYFRQGQNKKFAHHNSAKHRGGQTGINYQHTGCSEALANGFLRAAEATSDRTVALLAIAALATRSVLLLAAERDNEFVDAERFFAPDLFDGLVETDPHELGGLPGKKGFGFGPTPAMGGPVRSR